jgi:hypothetical protein
MTNKKLIKYCLVVLGIIGIFAVLGVLVANNYTQIAPVILPSYSNNNFTKDNDGNVKITKVLDYPLIQYRAYDTPDEALVNFPWNSAYFLQGLPTGGSPFGEVCKDLNNSKVKSVGYNLKNYDADISRIDFSIYLVVTCSEVSEPYQSGEDIYLGGFTSVIKGQNGKWHFSGSVGSGP